MIGIVDDAVVLDGFAGTGALGLEAWSRGARKVYFAEPDHHAASIVRQNIELIGAYEDAVLLQRPFQRAFQEITDPLDLIFLDPPYDSPLAIEAFALLSARQDLLSQDAMVIWESSADTDEVEPHGFTTWKSRSYGSTRIQIFLLGINHPEIP